jgi:hypothetical protein
MKRQFLVSIAIAVFAITFTTNADAQTARTVRANVKFDFQIGDRVYPPGTYWIESISRQSDNILKIRSVGEVNEQQIITVNHSIARERQTPKLVFEKYGETYFLTQIFLESGDWGYSIRPSRGQRESEHLASRLPGKN